MQAVKIGDSSIYGQLTQELKDDERDSPLKLKLKGLAHHISQFGYAGGVLIALAVMLHKAYLYGDFGAYFANTPLLLSDLVQAVILGIIIIVMAVPEGLPLMIAIVSSLNMKKMLRDNVLVRKLVGIETAGSLNRFLPIRRARSQRASWKSYGSLPATVRNTLRLTYCLQS